MNVQATSSATDTTIASRNTGGQLGKDEFLNLLVTQLKNQDPLDPMDNTESIAQMAQFSALEQMQNISNAMQLQTATTMIDKGVKAEVQGEYGTELVFGQVISAKQKDGDIYLTMQDGREIKASEAKSILGETGVLQEAQNLVGQRVYLRSTNTTDEFSMPQVGIIGVRVADDETGIGATKLIPETITALNPTLANAKSLIGQEVYVKVYKAGKETGLITKVKIKDGIWERNEEDGPEILKLVDVDGNKIAFTSYLCKTNEVLELKDIWNVVPSEEEI